MSLLLATKSTTHAEQVLFRDDFDGALDPAWSEQPSHFGIRGIVDGTYQLTATEDDGIEFFEVTYSYERGEVELHRNGVPLLNVH